MSVAAGSWMSRVAGIVVVVVMCTARAGAQGAPARLQLDVPGSLGSATALHCPVGQEFQIGMRAYDSSGVETPLGPYQPQASTSNDTVVVAAPAQHSAYILEVRCKADGRADLTVHTGNVTLAIPVVVGKGHQHGAAAPRAAGGGTAAPNGGPMPVADPSVPVNEIAVTLRSVNGGGGMPPTTLYVTRLRRIAGRQGVLGASGPPGEGATHLSMIIPWTDVLPRLLKAMATRDALQVTVDFYVTNPDGTVGVQQSIQFARAGIDTLRIDYDGSGAVSSDSVMLSIGGTATQLPPNTGAYTGNLSALRSAGMALSDAILTVGPGGLPGAQHVRLRRCSLVVTSGSSPAGRPRTTIELRSVLDGAAAAIARAPGHWQSATIDFAASAQSGQQVSAAKFTLTAPWVDRLETSFTGTSGVQDMVLSPGTLTLTIGQQTANDDWTP